MTLASLVIFLLPALLFMSWNVDHWKIFFGLIFKSEKYINNSKYDHDWRIFVLKQGINIAFGLVYGFLGYYMVLMDVTITGIIVWYLPMLLIYHIITAYIGYLIDEDNNNDIKVNMIIMLGSGIVLFAYIIIFGCVMPIVLTTNTYDYVDQYVIEDDTLINFSIGNIGIITEKTAARDVKTSMSEYDNISKYVAGGMYKQVINGNIAWICPLEYSSDIKAMGDAYIPGYTKIDASTTSNISIVNDMHIVYSPSGVFSNYLSRHVHESYPSVLLYKENFEIDDNGHAYWVIPYGHYIWYRMYETVDGVIIVDPETGEMEQYTVGNIPKWIDIVYPGNIVEMYCNDFGMNKLGWIAKTFYSTSQFKLTYWTGDDSWSILFDENGNMWYASDTTNMFVSDRTMIGYIMVNAHTGEIRYNPDLNGINGEGICQNFIQPYIEKSGWFLSEPAIYDLNGTPIWFAEILDSNGNIMKYCLGKLDGTYITESTIDGMLKTYARESNTEVVYDDTNTSSNGNASYSAVITLNNSDYKIEIVDGITYIYII